MWLLILRFSLSLKLRHLVQQVGLEMILRRIIPSPATSGQSNRLSKAAMPWKFDRHKIVLAVSIEVLWAS